MKRANSDPQFLEKLARMVRPLSFVIGIASVLAGLAIMVGCSLSGLGTALAGVGSFLIILAFTMLFVGSIYLLTRMSDDIRAVRNHLQSGKTDDSESAR